MKILTKNYIENNQEFIFSEIRKGKIFIYPTDTVLGIGCDATNNESIKKIYEIKQRQNKPLLIIIPNLNWLKNNCIINKTHQNELNSKLPGPYSFIVKLKDKNLFPNELLNNKDSIGIRIPKCFFSKIIKKLNLSFVTTSVNLSGEPSATKFENIPKQILNKIDYYIETNEIMTNSSSTILDITQKEIKKIR